MFFSIILLQLLISLLFEINIDGIVGSLKSFKLLILIFLFRKLILLRWFILLFLLDSSPIFILKLLFRGEIKLFIFWLVDKGEGSKKLGKIIFEDLLFIFFVNGLFWLFWIIFRNEFKFPSIKLYIIFN